MPINRLLRSTAFGPEEIHEIECAYEGALSALGLVDRTDPVTELVARTIIDCAAAGEMDCDKLRDCAIAAITSR